MALRAFTKGQLFVCCVGIVVLLTIFTSTYLFLDLYMKFQPRPMCYSVGTNFNTSLTQNIFPNVLPPTYQLVPQNVSLDKYEAFKQPITTDEYHAYMDVLKVFIVQCELHNIQYMLYGGTLLGSYRHFGMIPWDDDIDILCNVTQLPQLREALGKVTGYEFIQQSPKTVVWKFFKTRPANQTKNFQLPWDWPFLDIFFFYETTTHITDVNIRSFSFRKDDVFPLVREPFEGLSLSAPLSSTAVMRGLGVLHLTTCKSSHYSHKYEAPPTSTPVSVPCSELYPYFPFVFRSPAANRATDSTAQDVATCMEIETTATNVTHKPKPGLLTQRLQVGDTVFYTRRNSERISYVR